VPTSNPRLAPHVLALVAKARALAKEFEPLRSIIFGAMQEDIHSQPPGGDPFASINFTKGREPLADALEEAQTFLLEVSKTPAASMSPWRISREKLRQDAFAELPEIGG
jgi:hypothetical protein